MVTRKRLWTRAVPYILAALAVSAVLVTVMVNCRRGDVHEILSLMPIGSSVKDLKDVRESEGVEPGRVMMWVETDDPPTRNDVQIRRNGVVISTQFGIYLQRNLGPYDSWKPTDDEVERFTGEVQFYVSRPLGNLILIGFTFVSGKLVQKDWGYLPG